MKQLKKWIYFGLLGVAILYIISGLGITQYRIVEMITFGVLTKSLAFRIHQILLLPFIALLIAHVVIVIKNKKLK